MKTPKEHRVLLVCVGLLYVLLWTYAALHFQSVIPRFVPDDAFYYFKIAGNIAEGQGSVFSLGEPTNGYHPLWMAVLVSLTTLFSPDKKWFIMLGLACALLFHLLGALILSRYLRQRGEPLRTQTFGMELYLLLPWCLHLNASGLETSAFLCLLFWFYQHFETCLREVSESWKNYALLGISAGLLMLARTDAVLIALPLFLWLFFRGGFARLPWLVSSGCIATLMLAPWLFWNYKTFGSPVQSSGVAMGYIGHANRPAMSDPRYYLVAMQHAWSMLYRWLIMPFAPHTDYEQRYLLALRIMVVLAALSVLAAVFLWVRRKRFIVPPSVALPSALILGFYFFVRAYAQVWHMSILILLLILSLIELLRDVSWSRTAILVTRCGLFGLLLYSLSFGYYYPARNFFSEIERRNATTAVLRIGSTDCGVLGYFTKHHVVNLDGVVNNRALKYIQQGKLGNYIESQKLDVVEVYPGRLEYYNRHID